METQTPDLAARFILLKGELRLRIDARAARHGIVGVLDVLIGAMLMRVIGLFARLAARRSQQPACQDDTAVALRRLAAPGEFAPTRSMLVCDGWIDEVCIEDEGGECAADGRRELAANVAAIGAANLAAIGRSVFGLDYGGRVLEVPFAKMGFMGLGRIASYSLRISNVI